MMIINKKHWNSSKLFVLFALRLIWKRINYFRFNVLYQVWSEHAEGKFFPTKPSIALDDEDPAQRNTEKTPTARKATPRFV